MPSGMAMERPVLMRALPRDGTTPSWALLAETEEESEAIFPPFSARADYGTPTQSSRGGRGVQHLERS